MPRNQQLLLSSRAERLGKEVLNPGEGQAFIKRMAAAIGEGSEDGRGLHDFSWGDMNK